VVELFPLSKRRGRALWRAAFKNANLPPVSTKWFEIREGTAVVGWYACRYWVARGKASAILFPEGVEIYKEHRGRGLQNQARAVAIKLLHGMNLYLHPLRLRSYVNAENVASLRNCIKSGYLPVSTWREGKELFIRLEASL
jgi:RimJ/RimL family protein N-acetyltransferase